MKEIKYATSFGRSLGIKSQVADALQGSRKKKTISKRIS